MKLKNGNGAENGNVRLLNKIFNGILYFLGGVTITLFLLWLIKILMFALFS